MPSEENGGKGGSRTGRLFNIQRFSIEDGPGIRTTVFMKGCPLRCEWCHNPEGLVIEKQVMWFDARCIGARDCIEACDRGALSLTTSGMVIDRRACDGCGECAGACPAGALEVVGRDCSVHEALDEVMRDEAFYRNSGGGVTVSGGEPTMQPGFVEELLSACRGAGLHTALDTCGYSSRDALSRLLAHADMVLLDLKLMDPGRHRELTGVDLETVLESARTIARERKPVWVRTPIIPGRTDDSENIRRLGEFIASELPSAERWDLLAFNNTCGSKYERLDLDWRLDGAPLVEKSKMEELAAVATETGAAGVQWSGVTRREE